MALKNKDNLSEDVLYKPSTLTRIGGGISYRFVGFSSTFGMPLKESEKLVRGDTGFEDWRFNYTFKKYQASLSYQTYRDFYIENTKDFDSGWSEGDAYNQEPNLTLRNFSWNIFYVFDPEKYSLKGFFDQSAR